MANHDISNITVGCRAFSVELGECIVSSILPDNGYDYTIVAYNPSETISEVYTRNGLHIRTAIHPSLFMSAEDCAVYFRKVAEDQSEKYTQAIISQVCEEK